MCNTLHTLFVLNSVWGRNNISWNPLVCAMGLVVCKRGRLLFCYSFVEEKNSEEQKSPWDKWHHRKFIKMLGVGTYPQRSSWQICEEWDRKRRSFMQPNQFIKAIMLQQNIEDLWERPSTPWCLEKVSNVEIFLLFCLEWFKFRSENGKPVEVVLHPFLRISLRKFNFLWRHHH